VNAHASASVMQETVQSQTRSIINLNLSEARMKLDSPDEMESFWWVELSK
jgi:hypothetical protein